ncbi:MAG: response regulator [Acidobacteria bacterium]|nr:response regulator [Acidobacteriota bacterium]
MPPSRLLPTGGARTVLVADDDDVSRGAVVRAMQAAGLQTLEASTPEEVVDLARRHKPGAITLALVARPDDAQATIDQLTGDPITGDIPIVIVLDDQTSTDAGTTLDTTELVAKVERLLKDRHGAVVLVADDDANLRLVLRQLLVRHGYRIVEAANGREAIAAASRERLDLVLLDLRMPLLHGHDVIRALRKHEATARIPIIVLSGSVGERHSLESLVLDANMFFTKPAELEVLVREIDRLLRQDTAD